MTITSRIRSAGSLLMILAVLPVLAACRTDGVSSAGNSGSSSNSGTGGNTETTSYTIDEPVTKISFDGRAGKVRVQAKDGPVSVTERARWAENKPVTTHQVNGDTLELREQGCPNRTTNGPCQVDWEITAPAGTVLGLETNAGSVEVQGMAGEVTVRCGAGDVSATQLTSKRINAISETGDVRLAFSQAPDDVIATAETGDVEITVPSGTAYAVRSSASVGDETVDVQQDTTSGHVIRAKSDVGDVQITNR